MRTLKLYKSLIRTQQRGFLSNFKDVSEEEIIQRIDINSRTYTHHEKLAFDPLGRFLLYDNIQFTLKSKPRVINTVITMASYYVAYIYYFANPYLPYHFYAWSTVAALTTLFNLGRFADSRTGIVRFYLLDNLQTIRLENGIGGSIDAPISAVQLIQTSRSNPLINFSINGKRYTFKIMPETYILPHILYAIMQSQVAQVISK